MATVLERFNHLGLAHCNPVLQLCGEHVASHLGHYNPYFDEGIKKRAQVENGHTYWVNDYPERQTKRMDEEILNWVFNATRKGRKQTQQERDWWKDYKGKKVKLNHYGCNDRSVV